MELQIELLHKKLDDIMEILTRTTIVKKKWSLENYKEAVLIKCDYCDNFKSKLKDLGGHWIATKKAWVFPKSKDIEVHDTITGLFGDWSFTDLRE